MKRSNGKSIIWNIWNSITSFEKYQEYATEKNLNTFIYFIILVTIFSIVAAITYSINVYIQINEISNYIDSNVDELYYKESKLTINNNQKSIIEKDNEYVIIDTQKLDESQIKEYENNINDKDRGTVILNDRIMIKNRGSTETVTFLYKNLAMNEDITINKQNVQEMIKGRDLVIFLIALATATVVAMFFVYSLTLLIYAIILAALGKLSCFIIRLPIAYKSLLKISIHALTLSTVLYTLYFAVNLYTGFTINYFQIMYSAIAYIYLITAIFIIKADYLKKQVELSEIRNEQARIRDEYKDTENKENDTESK